MKTLSISSPGKIHLLGEHSVVYGKPAVIASVNKRCHIRITDRTDSLITLSDTKTKKTIQVSISKVVSFFKKAQTQLEKYHRTQDKSILTEITKTPFSYPLIIIGEVLHFYNPEVIPGFSMEINSEIPNGRGMGSSAAVAVSITAGLTVFLGMPWNLQVINSVSFLAEEKIHGTPSGGDNAACTYGGFLLYQKKQDKKEIQRLDFSDSQSVLKDFFLVDTGKPTETTGEMVGYIKDMMGKDEVLRKQMGRIFVNQEKLVYILLSALKEKNYPLIASAIKMSEQNLEKLGVVSESSKRVIRALESAGASAKVCGAGGRKSNSGIVLGFGHGKEQFKQLASIYSAQFLNVSLGSGGVRLE